MDPETYKMINKEIILEVQKLRVKIKEKEDHISIVENELYREKQENSKLKIFISKTFNSFYNFNTQFSSNYEDLIRSGITGIEMSASTTESNPSSVRSSRCSADQSERVTILRRRHSVSPGNSINVCLPNGFVKSPRVVVTQKEIVLEDEENEDPEAERYEAVSGTLTGSDQQKDMVTQENMGLSVINETQRENNFNSPIIEEEEDQEEEQENQEDETTNLTPSEMEIETPRVSLKRPATSRPIIVPTDLNVEESFQLSNSILDRVASTPYVPRRLSEATSKTSEKELVVVVKKIRLSEEDIQEFSRHYGDTTSASASAVTECTTESTLTEEAPKKKRTKKVRSTERRSTGRPKRLAKPRSGSLVERPINSKLRRSK